MTRPDKVQTRQEAVGRQVVLGGRRPCPAPLSSVPVPRRVLVFRRFRAASRPTRLPGRLPRRRRVISASRRCGTRSGARAPLRLPGPRPLCRRPQRHPTRRGRCSVGHRRRHQKQFLFRPAHYGGLVNSCVKRVKRGGRREAALGGLVPGICPRAEDLLVGCFIDVDVLPCRDGC